MEISLLEGFTKSLALAVISEIGDNTFFAAAILAMRYPRGHVLSGCLASLAVMTILSVLVGWAAPNLISRTFTHYVTTLLFIGLGLLALREGLSTDGDEDELAEAEEKLEADAKKEKASSGGSKDNDDDKKKQQRSVLRQFFSPVFLKAFSLTFFGEWGDRSQIATIGLAANENPFGVVLGGILGQALCTIAAVFGGRTLAAHISERMVTLASGVLFLVFGVLSFLSSVDD